MFKPTWIDRILGPSRIPPPPKQPSGTSYLKRGEPGTHRAHYVECTCGETFPEKLTAFVSFFVCDVATLVCKSCGATHVYYQTGIETGSATGTFFYHGMEEKLPIEFEINPPK